MKQMPMVIMCCRECPFRHIHNAPPNNHYEIDGKNLQLVSVCKFSQMDSEKSSSFQIIKDIDTIPGFCPLEDWRL